MKVTVVKSFIDKETKKVHPLKEVFDCSKERYEQIKKYVDVVEAEKASK